METNEQITLVKKLSDLKNKIVKSQDKEAITLYIQEVIKISTPVQPYVDERLANSRYKQESKIRAISLLEGDIDCVKSNSYPDWETVHFQVASSIAMLALNFVEGGVSRLNELSKN
jgi:hypothetical protein